MRPFAGIFGSRSSKKVMRRSFQTRPFSVLAIDECEQPFALAVTPGSPTGMIFTPMNTQVALAWTQPASNGGTSITDYQVDWKPAATTAKNWTTFNDGVLIATNATVTGLTNGSAYVFRVTAFNALGAGTVSIQTLAATPERIGLHPACRSRGCCGSARQHPRKSLEVSPRHGRVFLHFSTCCSGDRAISRGTTHGQAGCVPRPSDPAVADVDRGYHGR